MHDQALEFAVSTQIKKRHPWRAVTGESKDCPVAFILL